MVPTLPDISPLSHITTALREDNRALLIETLLRDPRCPDETPLVADTYLSPELQRQNLIFSTSHLRRTLLHNVLKKNDEKKQRRKKKGNRTQVEEEEDMMSDLNEELLGGGMSLQIVVVAWQSAWFT